MPPNGYSNWELEVVQRLARIEEKHDYVLRWIAAHDKQDGETRGRVDSLEQSRSRAIGAITVISFLWAVILAAVGALWKKFIVGS